MTRILASLLLYLVALVALRQAWPQGILFYQGLALACGVAVLHGWWAWRHRKDESGSTRLKDTLLVFSLAYGFMFTVPTTADRSYSVQMILLLSQHPEGLPSSALEAHFREQFVRQGGVNRRIQEQLATGTVQVEQDQRVKLTPRGENLARASRLTCRMFACQASPP